jgi:hypothetical protein
MISPDDIVLGCYELAKFYQIDPRVFLEQTISEINRHKMWTVRLTERMRAAQEAEMPPTER